MIKKGAADVRALRKTRKVDIVDVLEVVLRDNKNSDEPSNPRRRVCVGKMIG
jgi:hypothetical protein